MITGSYFQNFVAKAPETWQIFTFNLHDHYRVSYVLRHPTSQQTYAENCVQRPDKIRALVYALHPQATVCLQSYRLFRQTVLYMQLDIAPCPDPFDSQSAQRPPQVPGCLKCHRVTHRLASAFTADTDYQRTRTDRLRKWKNYVNQGCTNPRKIEQPPQNSRCKNSDTMRVPHWRPNNIWYLRTKT
jgi:hypothetical protein